MVNVMTGSVIGSVKKGEVPEIDFSFMDGIMDFFSSASWESSAPWIVVFIMMGLQFRNFMNGRNSSMSVFSHISDFSFQSGGFSVCLVAYVKLFGAPDLFIVESLGKYESESLLAASLIFGVGVSVISAAIGGWSLKLWKSK
jgi:hypothetical protein